MLETYRKLRNLLNPRERRRALLLLALMLMVGLVEVAGVASIVPLIAVLTNPDLIETNRYLHGAYTTLGFTDANGFLIFLSAAVFLVVVGRTSLTALSSYALLRFTHMRGHVLSTRLLETYLRRKYSWFLNRHSAELGECLFSQVSDVVSGSLLPGLQLIAQGIIAICIIALVIAVDPFVALIATLTLGLAYGAIYLCIRTLLERVGRERAHANRERYRIAQEALGGIKEVKIAGLEKGYLRRFGQASRTYERRRSSLQVLSEMPRYALEVIAIGGMLLVIMALLVRNDGNLLAVLPAIAVYAFAGVRLLPVMQVLYRAVVALRASGPVVDRLHREFADDEVGPELTMPPPMPLTRAIQLRHVSFAYPNAERTALRDVSLTIPVHAAVGFVGKTGAGKSTIIDLILGLLEPQKGELLVDGTTIGQHNVRAWQRAIGYVPQHIFLADECIAANIAFGTPLEKIDMAAVERCARMACLHDFVTGELPHGYNTLVGERGMRLSGGQRQRVSIARALYHNPQVLILDEATSALDNITEQAIMEAVKHLAAHMTIIIIAHRLTTVQGCDTIFVLDGGRLTGQGTVSELSKKHSMFLAQA